MTPPRPNPRPSTRRHRGLSRELVVDAAIRRLRRFGPEKLSIRALAKDLGVTPMAIYRHVPSKEKLLEEVRASLLTLVPLVLEAERDEARSERPLSEADVIEEALHLVGEEGLAALSMRALAQRLGVSAMALYRHVPNKNALLARMSDTLIQRLPTPEPSPTAWQDDFRAHARLVWREFSRYPGLVGSFASGPSPLVLEHMRYERSIFEAGGTDERKAALAVTVYHTFLLGLFRTHAYLDVLERRDAGKSGVSAEAIRRFGRRMTLTDLLDFFIDAMITSVAGPPPTVRSDGGAPGGPSASGPLPSRQRAPKERKILMKR
jgi:AcrR family transcriptional regulator